MKRIKKIPKHLKPFLMGGDYKLVSSYKNGFYLTTMDQLLYITDKEPLSALSVLIDTNDLRDLKATNNFKFYIDDYTDEVSLEIRASSIDLNKLQKRLMLVNPGSAITGVVTTLDEAIKYIDKLVKTRGYNSLLGRGLGLTPSGDDIISGIVYVEYITNKKIIKEKLDLNLTNKISKALLIEALSGRYSEDLVELASTNKDVTKQLKQILDYGSTSGADLLTGIYYGLLQV